MSAERLREATTRLRTLAEAADESGNNWYDADDLSDALDGIADIGDDHEADGRYVAAMPPSVGLTLADWLSDEFDRWNHLYQATQRGSKGVDDPPAANYRNPARAASDANYHCRRALAVADAILGGAA